MVKAPSSHGLDRKYKPWRKGKSLHSKRRSSLKQQLRGLERSLKRAKDDAHREGLENRIRLLKDEISSKQEVEKERQHAKQSHGPRFLERQKLVRAFKNTRSNPNISEEDKEKELVKIALDQVYVAHYPMDIKYMPLFQQGVRRVDPPKLLARRAKTRRRILSQNFSSGKRPSTGPKNWISEEQYDRVVAIANRNMDWPIEKEREYFGEASESTEIGNEDARFSAPSQHEALLAAAEQAEAELDQEGTPRDNSKEIENTKDSKEDESASEGESSDDGADPLKPSQKRKRNEESTSKKNPDEGEHTGDKDDASTVGSSSDDDSDDSSTSSSSSSDDNNSVAEKSVDKDVESSEVQTSSVMMEDDDFLVPVADSADDGNVFAKPHERMAAVDRVSGDKSQGWATQRQRPNQFKKQNAGRGRDRRRW